MFWNRAAREARRQQVLDELIELAPEARQARLDRAVAEGDVRAAEVDQALRLVGRLDALRVMTVPGTRRTAPSPEETAVEPPQPAPTKTAARPKRRSRRRVAVQVGPNPPAALADDELATRPSRATTQAASLRKAGRAIGGSPRRRRVRVVAMGQPQTPAMAALEIAAEAADAAQAPEEARAQAVYAMAAAPATLQEEQWPSISWLRPE